MSEPTHQLVIQFPESAFPDFDELVGYEDVLILTLGDTHEVDGHDVGSGEVNFFVFTDDPTGALGTMRDARSGALLSHPEVRVAARLIEGEDLALLWPIGDERAFTVV